MDGRFAKTDAGCNCPVDSSGCTVYSKSFCIPEISRMDLLAILLKIFTDAGVRKEDLFWYRLAIDEAIINAITHGHLEDADSPRTLVKVDCTLDGKTVSVRVSDSGFGFNPRCIPDPTLDENLWNISGRGIFLMQEAMDEVTFNDIGNSVQLKRSIEQTGEYASEIAGQKPPNT